jgi:hypothetical protein
LENGEYLASGWATKDRRKSLADAREVLTKRRRGYIVYQRIFYPSAIVFVCLNVVDARLTTQLLHHGGVEAFWWSASFSSNMLVKGLLALAVSLAVIQLDKPRLLLWLNIGMSIVVLLNGTSFLAYLAGFYSLL